MNFLFQQFEYTDITPIYFKYFILRSTDVASFFLIKRLHNYLNILSSNVRLQTWSLIGQEYHAGDSGRLRPGYRIVLPSQGASCCCPLVLVYISHILEGHLYWISTLWHCYIIPGTKQNKDLFTILSN